MFPVVVIRQPGHTPIHLQVREAIEVGRECTGVLLADPRVSRRHLVLAPTHDGGPAEVAVLDLGSMNGTLLDGTRLTTEVVLRPGQQVRLGETTIALVVDPPAGDPAADVSATTVMGAVDDPGATTVMRTAPRARPERRPRPPAEPRTEPRTDPWARPDDAADAEGADPWL